MPLITRPWLFANRTAAGSWTQAQIEALGIAWPPTSGWQQRIMGSEISGQSAAAFEAGASVFRRGKGHSPAQQPLLDSAQTAAPDPALAPPPRHDLRTYCPPPVLPDSSDPVVLYADGGCSPNPGTGGWGCVLGAKGTRLELGGGEAVSTNNRMELMAVIAGLERLKRPCAVHVTTDSQYVVGMMTAWIADWSSNHWSKSRGGHKPPVNLDLVQRLAKAAFRHQTQWSWVKGHSGHRENERCDEIATAMVSALRKGGTAALENKCSVTVIRPIGAGRPGCGLWLTAAEKTLWCANP